MTTTTTRHCTLIAQTRLLMIIIALTTLHKTKRRQ
jgi:hypothetical protein